MASIDLGQVVGPPGPQGERGPEGATGATGPQGLQGERGPGSNPNLVINWYFADPIDQREGYVVPPGTAYRNADNTISGVTDNAYYPARWGTNYAEIVGFTTDDGELLYCLNTDTVRGYVGSGYTINGWRANKVTVLKKDDYVSVIGNASGSYWLCYFENEFTDGFLGKQITLSALDNNGNLHTASEKLPETNPSGTTAKAVINIGDGVYLDFIYGGVSGMWSVRLYFSQAGSSFDFKVPKLELGDKQTLARQDENGNWVLIDPPPKKGAVLAECQRYLLPLVSDQVIAHAIGTNTIFFSIPIPVTLRATPALIGDLTVKNMSGVVQTGFTFSVSSASANRVVIAATKAAHGLTWAYLVASPSTFLSAEL